MLHTRSVVFLLAFAASMAFVRPAHAQSSLSVITRFPDADIINAGSIFDPMADRVKDLPPATFSLTFVNTTTPRKPITAHMHIETYVTLDEDRERMQLYTADTKTPFVIPPEGRVFTARDTRGLDDIQFNSVKNDAAIEKVKDKIWDPASGGRVPSGTYEIVITMTVVQVGTEQTHDVVPVPVNPVVVTNPTVAALLVPSENGYRYPTVFPQFQWISDTRSVMLTVYEKREGQESLEDATRASDPYFQARIDRRASGNRSVLTYPQTSAPLPGTEILRDPRPLEPGKTYVLVLEGIRSSIGTTTEPLRTICSFTIDSPNATAQSRLHRSVFTAAEFQSIVDLIENRGLTMESSGITLNGSPITLQRLQTYLSEHRNRQFTFEIEE